ncbi:hypothetical protein HI914_00739 [Erysiphe necator]|nr:hypothetical protein HI914_00739 [Erysiphe necator]
MTKIPHWPIVNFPTHEIYARFAPGTLDTIKQIRNKYTTNLIYPRDIGICLFRGITKNVTTTKTLHGKLTTIASSVAPFQVEVLRPFRNRSAEERNYPASVYYEISNSPFNLLCIDLIILFKKHFTQYLPRPQINKSFKIGITGEVKSYEESDKIVTELKTIEKPNPLLFDAFVLASRPNQNLLSRLDDEIQEFPFTANKETFELYLQNLKAKRDVFFRKKLEKNQQNGGEILS